MGFLQDRKKYLNQKEKENLRDQFATIALRAILNDREEMKGLEQLHEEDAEKIALAVSKWAYMVADSMLIYRGYGNLVDQSVRHHKMPSDIPRVWENEDGTIGFCQEVNVIMPKSFNESGVIANGGHIFGDTESNDYAIYDLQLKLGDKDGRVRLELNADSSIRTRSGKLIGTWTDAFETDKPFKS